MLLYFIAFLLTIMFFVSSFEKMMIFNKKVEGFTKVFGKKLFDIPDWISKLFIVCAILIQFFCPLIIMYSIYDTRYHMLGVYASLMLAFLQ
jgi:hypothetical protein